MATLEPDLNMIITQAYGGDVQSIRRLIATRDEWIDTPKGEACLDAILHHINLHPTAQITTDGALKRGGVVLSWLCHPQTLLRLRTFYGECMLEYCPGLLKWLVYSIDHPSDVYDEDPLAALDPAKHALYAAATHIRSMFVDSPKTVTDKMDPVSVASVFVRLLLWRTGTDNDVEVSLPDDTDWVMASSALLSTLASIKKWDPGMEAVTSAVRALIHDKQGCDRFLFCSLTRWRIWSTAPMDGFLTAGHLARLAQVVAIIGRMSTPLHYAIASSPIPSLCVHPTFRASGTFRDFPVYQARTIAAAIHMVSTKLSVTREADAARLFQGGLLREIHFLAMTSSLCDRDNILGPYLPFVGAWGQVRLLSAEIDEALRSLPITGATVSRHSGWPTFEATFRSCESEHRRPSIPGRNKLPLCDNPYHRGPSTRSKACMLCGEALYCSQACQIQDWHNSHKGQCKDELAFISELRSEGRWVNHQRRLFLLGILERLLNNTEVQAELSSIATDNEYAAVYYKTFRFPGLTTSLTRRDTYNLTSRQVPRRLTDTLNLERSQPTMMETVLMIVDTFDCDPGLVLVGGFTRVTAPGMMIYKAVQGAVVPLVRVCK